MSELIHFSQAGFDAALNKPNTLMLVDFWATWCGPCRMVAPVIEELAGDYDDVIVGKVDVDEESDLAMRYQVMSIPTIILFKDGKEVNRMVGVRSKSDYVAAIEAAK